MAFQPSDLNRLRRMIEAGEEKIAAQEHLIERLRLYGHPTEEAREFLRTLQDLHALQIGLRNDVERQLKRDSTSS